eukprot:64676_1
MGQNCCIQKQQPFIFAYSGDCNLSQCIALKGLINVLSGKYSGNASNSSSWNADAFGHLLSCHNNTTNDFQYIYNKLGGFCEIQRCKIFRRNYHHKSTENSKQFTTNTPITDQIHCFYRHCFDLGNRLSIQEQSIVNKITNETLQDKDTLTIDDQTIDQQTVKMSQIIREKQRRNFNIIELCERRQKQHNQLIIVTDQNDKKNDDNIYSVGYNFKYDYNGEQEWNDSAIYIQPKYESLKQEIISNQIHTLCIHQFNNEYEKALIRFNTNYRKQNYRNDINMNNHCEFTVEFLLSFMFYCNYTELQCEFSKTYREYNGLRHDNFYHLGKNIKQC